MRCYILVVPSLLALASSALPNLSLTTESSLADASANSHLRSSSTSPDDHSERGNPIISTVTKKLKRVFKHKKVDSEMMWLDYLNSNSDLKTFLTNPNLHIYAQFLDIYALSTSSSVRDKWLTALQTKFGDTVVAELKKVYTELEPNTYPKKLVEWLLKQDPLQKEADHSLNVKHFNDLIKYDILNALDNGNLEVFQDKTGATPETLLGVLVDSAPDKELFYKDLSKALPGLQTYWKVEKSFVLKDLWKRLCIGVDANNVVVSGRLSFFYNYATAFEDREKQVLEIMVNTFGERTTAIAIEKGFTSMNTRDSAHHLQSAQLNQWISENATPDDIRDLLQIRNHLRDEDVGSSIWVLDKYICKQIKLGMYASYANEHDGYDNLMIAVITRGLDPETTLKKFVIRYPTVWDAVVLKDIHERRLLPPSAYQQVLDNFRVGSDLKDLITNPKLEKFANSLDLNNLFLTRHVRAMWFTVLEDFFNAELFLKETNAAKAITKESKGVRAITKKSKGAEVATEGSIYEIVVLELMKLKKEELLPWQTKLVEWLIPSEIG
ncbi:hypothetical protein CCR75_002192 [Bremia lactucae]|uniref:RxLR effector protein n=1 Tax=Bremia lactucae TaxID=4779 RepID=A0A976FRN5_BRELC|nr:hypothetical protein CCR75_002192 [Bremia lactucae]